ncbi:sensor histidine kinase [Fredinandcohnia humi]
MATKWKNSIGILASLLITIGLIGISVFGTFANQFFIVNYFETSNFQHERNEIWHMISKYEIYNMPVEEAKSNLIVTKAEIETARSERGDLQSSLEQINVEYGYEIDAAKASGDTNKVEELTEERDQKLAKMTAFYKDDDYIKEQLLKKKKEIIDSYYEELVNMESHYENNYKVSFVYYLKDIDTGEIITNLTSGGEEYFTEENMLFIEDWDYNLTPIGPPGINLEEKHFVGKLGLIKDGPDTIITNNYKHFLKTQQIFYGYAIGGIIALLVGLLLLKKMNMGKNSETLKRFMPIDLTILLAIISGTFAIFVLNDSQVMYLYMDKDNLRNVVSNFGVLFLVVGITAFLVKLVVTRLVDSELRIADLKDSISYKGYQAVKEAFLNRSIGTQTILLLVIIVAFIPGGVVIGNMWNPFPYLYMYIFLFIFLAIPAIYIILKRAGYFNRILENTSELVKGNLVSDIEVKGKFPLATLARNINELKSGVELSQKEQLKSERLKTELITNVSHDLRTPLTSIISYSELLKKPGLSEEERNSYLEIIDRKSKRLKVLIDDLFEASKMASGNIELERSVIDIKQLLEQALAEHEEKMNESTLIFRISKPESPVYVKVDGQKVWRVFDNLIGNILKYSMDHTRVYIQVSTEKEKAVITFKNVTKYELGENVDELFERFKRGDTSRYTEGSGLGLAIAKSIVDLHQGQMDIELDGDLFKVTVCFDSVAG